jgi:hypothetical protein
MSPTRRTSVHWLLVAAILAVLAWTGHRALARAALDSDLEFAESEAIALDRALHLYRERTGSFPDSFGEAGLDRRTLEPLRRRGYYEGHITTVLLDGRVDAYAAPDDRGSNQEFWMEMSLERNPSIRLLLVHSDDAPLSGGRWLDGVYVYRRGELDKL